MSVLANVARTYSSPRRAFRQTLAATASEGRAFAYLLAGSAAHFLGRLPELAAERPNEEFGMPLAAAAAGIFLGLVIFAPIALYALAALGNLAARMLRRGVAWRNARTVLFWSFAAVSPLAVARGLAAVPARSDPSLELLLDAVVGVCFLWFWLIGMSEAARAEAEAAGP